MEIFKLQQSEQKEIYFHLNAKGTVFTKVTSKTGKGSARVWWTLGPLGKNKHLGHFPDGTHAFDIEGFIWGRLKAQASEEAIAIQVHDDPSVGYNFPKFTF